jgi:putative transposase
LPSAADEHGIELAALYTMQHGLASDAQAPRRFLHHDVALSYLIIDRDTKYSQRFRQFVDEGGAKVIRLPPLSPNLNAYAERFIRSIKEECLTKLISLGRRPCVVRSWST